MFSLWKGRQGVCGNVLVVSRTRRRFTMLFLSLLGCSDKTVFSLQSDHLAADCTNDPVTAPSPDAADYKSSWKPLQFLSIPILKEYLAHEFAFTDTPVRLSP